ncbi:MAG TPA: hypothetical protein VLC07_02370 [Solirubrobacterales bacterium]|nr:hypothetical protein [Solirubrobacterales bacterium]
MVIEIADAPRLVDDDKFSSVSILVPLNETPTASWLGHFRHQKELPGIAHRITEGGIVVHLDRGDFDILDAIRRIASGITKANSEAAESAETDEKAAIQQESEKNSKRKKLDGQLAQWWEEQQKKAPGKLQSA